MDNAFFAKLMEFKEVIQGFVSNTGSGWATTGTTTLTGNVEIEGDGHSIGIIAPSITLLGTSDAAIDIFNDGITNIGDPDTGAKITINGAEQGNTIELSGGEVGIGGAAVEGAALAVEGNLLVKGGSYPSGFQKIDTANAYAFMGDANADNNGTSIIVDEGGTIVGTPNTIVLSAAGGIKADVAIPAYTNNAAAVAAIGTGKLYYTDVAGEYIVKMSH
jgi:hypothetical protein